MFAQLRQNHSSGAFGICKWRNVTTSKNNKFKLWWTQLCITELEEHLRTNVWDNYLQTVVMGKCCPNPLPPWPGSRHGHNVTNPGINISNASLRKLSDWCNIVAIAKLLQIISSYWWYWWWGWAWHWELYQGRGCVELQKELQLAIIGNRPKCRQPLLRQPGKQGGAAKSVKPAKSLRPSWLLPQARPAWTPCKIDDVIGRRADNTNWGLDNSQYHAIASFNQCFIAHWYHYLNSTGCECF